MGLTVKIVEATFENFIGFYNGLGKKKVYLNLEKLLDKDIILILGENGKGKSTLSSILHPMPGTTDKRNKFIREGKDGLKIIRYRRSDDVEYECKLVYTPTKTGHNTKGYIKKFFGTESIELNPNGNISSYKEIIFEEIGVSDAILRLSSQNDTMKGLVDLTSTERKIDMSKFLPEDIYLHYYNIIDKTFKEFRTRINIIVDNMGKMPNEETLNTQLTKITDEINELVEKRDKHISKITEYKTKIEILEKKGDLEKLYNKTTKLAKNLNDDIIELREKMKSIYLSIENIVDSELTIRKIAAAKSTISEQIIELEKISLVISNNIDRLKKRRNDVADDIQSKESILADITSDATLEELKEFKKQYTKRYDDLDKMISKLDTSLTKEDLLTGYDIVATIRKGIININAHDTSAVKDALKDIEEHNIESILQDLYNKRDKAQQISTELSTRIKGLNENSHLKDILDKRPTECAIDDCPFIETAQKWKTIEKEIDKYTELLEKTDSNSKDIYEKISYYEDVSYISRDIRSLLNYVKLNQYVINKLPYNEKYNTEEALLKSIKKRDSLNYADDFDNFIEILEFKDEWNELKYKKIPSIDNEIKLIETQGKIISNAKDDLKRLKSEEDSMSSQIKENKKNLEGIEESLFMKRDILKKLDNLYDLRTEHDEKFDIYKEAGNEIKELKSDLDEYNDLHEKLKKRKERLKEIDTALIQPSRNREFYKMQQIKLAEYKIELDALQQDMYKVTIIRDSLSIKEGIPVDVMKMYMDDIRQNANTLLANTFNGSLYLEEFIIDEKDFIMPFKKNGGYGPDISVASSSERSFISLCLALAIIDEIVTSYGIMGIDEIDRGFDDENKYLFINILGGQIHKVGISQTFMATHNREYYESYDLGFILFPGHGLKNYNKNDVIKVYD